MMNPLATPVPTLGLLMLDMRFPRPLGDIGNPESFGVPVRSQVVQGVWPATVVQSAEALRAAQVLPQFVVAARALAARGVQAITTNCGFPVLLQDELQAAVSVPVGRSSPP